MLPVELLLSATRSTVYYPRIIPFNAGNPATSVLTNIEFQLLTLVLIGAGVIKRKLYH